MRIAICIICKLDVYELNRCLNKFDKLGYAEHVLLDSSSANDLVDGRLASYAAIIDAVMAIVSRNDMHVYKTTKQYLPRLCRYRVGTHSRRNTHEYSASLVK